ncbi:hypothetical protein PT2222_240075 [Paraburkholderia tropica]
MRKRANLSCERASPVSQADAAWRECAHDGPAYRTVQIKCLAWNHLPYPEIHQKTNAHRICTTY